MVQNYQYCDQYPCDIIPSEPTHKEPVKKIDVEKQWAWEDEKLMKAYTCKKNIDEFRHNSELPVCEGDKLKCKSQYKNVGFILTFATIRSKII